MRRRHVDFTNEKMKVRLAVQVLSRSTARALEFCKDTLKHPEFQDALPTITFCDNMNKAFDILNSKIFLDKTPTNIIIRVDNLKYVELEINKLIDYIKSFLLRQDKKALKYASSI